MKKRTVGFIVLFAALAMAWAGAVNAAEFPSKRITYNICFNPGGESDITARIQEQALKKYLGADVAIQYKIGGGGALCWSELVQSAPDGYTIAGHNLPHTILQPMEMGDAGYKTLDLKQIYMFESTPNVLMVRKDSPFQTLKDFVDYAKKNPRRRDGGGQRHLVRERSGNHHARQGGGDQIDVRPLRRDRLRRACPTREPRDGAHVLLPHGGPI